MKPDNTNRREIIHALILTAVACAITPLLVRLFNAYLAARGWK